MSAQQENVKKAIENVLSRYRKRYSSDSDDEEEELRPLYDIQNERTIDANILTWKFESRELASIRGVGSLACEASSCHSVGISVSQWRTWALIVLCLVNVFAFH